MAVYASQLGAKGPFANAAPPSVTTHPAPAGTFLPGTKVQVGDHRVIIDRYLSEGGFAHVYVVTMPRPVDGHQKAVLKRVAVPDKDHLVNMRTEVETMKRLRGQKYIVKYIDSHASQLKGGGYEVFLLMEFCQGGGLIDFMNTRLQNRLTEPEILKIFTDVAEGVACMHYLKPPLMHRDLKIENVLISMAGSSRIFKLCDFGSAAVARPAAASAAEGRIIEDDINRHTTLQYRSPEMIDVYRKQPIDEKSDIWALGVFLYKLCYYTTPFEDVGQMAILHARFKFPAYPRFSDQLKLLIASMLRENPSDRPNIYQVLQKASSLDGRELTIKDIYTRRTQSESRKDQSKPLPLSPNSQPRAGATLSPPKQEAPASLPQVEPMRRGRPTKPVSHHGSAKPSPSPLRMVEAGPDPFAALDGTKFKAEDELSHKFPTLDQFALLTDQGKKFSFEPTSDNRNSNLDPRLAQRVTNALADEAFARSSSPAQATPVVEKPAVAGKPQALLERKRSQEIKESSGRASAPAVPSKSAMVSTGTMTSASPPSHTLLPLSDRPVHRFPAQPHPPRSSSLQQPPTQPKAAESSRGASRLSTLLQEDARRSQATSEVEPRSPTSSRPSLEGGRPSVRDVSSAVHRSRSLNMRNRPASVNIGKGLTHIKDREIRRLDYEETFASAEPELPALTHSESATNISSDVEFLRAREEEEKEKRHHHKRLSSSSKQAKRSSLPSIGLSGTTKLLAGKFGDAFKKFEGGDTNNQHQYHHHHLIHHHHHERSESLPRDPGNVLTPIAGSEATDLSDDRQNWDETEDLSPEMRRELEKRKLEAEERRVANAAAEYRQRLAAKDGSGGTGATTSGGGGPMPGRASTIQNRVQSLLSENERPAVKTASGYGRYTTTPEPIQQHHERAQTFQPNRPVHTGSGGGGHPATKVVSAPASAVDLTMRPEARSQRPVAPPKPKVLRSAAGDASSNSDQGNGGLDEDWETNFSKRYPDLSGLEMVETSIHEPMKQAVVRTKEI